MLENVYVVARPGVIAYIEVHDGGARETYYEPTSDDVKKMCDKYGFDYDYTLSLILGKAKDAYCVIFIADLFKAHLAERRPDEGLHR